MGLHYSLRTSQSQGRSMARGARTITWDRTARRPQTTGSPPEPSWTVCTAAICAEQMEELQMFGPAGTGGSLCSGWPGDAAAAQQTNADEGQWHHFSLKINRTSQNRIFTDRGKIPYLQVWLNHGQPHRDQLQRVMNIEMLYCSTVTVTTHVSLETKVR